MSPENFCYWLQGYNELSGGRPIDTVGWKVLQDHLALVFNKVTPKRQIYNVQNLDSMNQSLPFGEFAGPRGDTVPVLTKGLFSLVEKRNCGDVTITYNHQDLDKLPVTMSTC